MRNRWFAGSVLSFLLGASASAQAQVVTRSDQGRVWVKATGAPLGKVLEELAAHAGSAELMIDEEAARLPVTLELAGATPLEAIEATLSASGASFVVMRFAAAPRVYAGTRAVARVGAEVARQAAPGTEGADSTAPEAAAAADPVIAERRAEEDQKALSAILAVPRATSGVVTLPFPGPDGVPLQQDLDARPSTPPALPFPVREAAQVPPSAVPGTPAAAPPVTLTPEEKRLWDLLAPRTPPKQD